MHSREGIGATETAGWGTLRKSESMSTVGFGRHVSDSVGSSSSANPSKSQSTHSRASVNRSDSMASSDISNDFVAGDDEENFDEHDGMIGNDAESTAILSPLHKQILTALKHSTKLKPLFIGAKNESYWYYSRRKLSPLKQLKVIAKQNQHSMRWESYVYTMQRNDDWDLVPQLYRIPTPSTHKTKWLAVKRGDQFCAKERDKCLSDDPSFDPQLADQLMQTHFKILVVSECFYGLSNAERICMIWEELVQGMGVPLNSSQDATISDGGWATVPPSNGMKLASIWGPHMCALDIFRSIVTKFPFRLIIMAKTPSQWKPDLYSLSLSEKYGSSAVGITSTAMLLTANQHADPRAIKKRVSLLAKSGMNRHRGSALNTELFNNTNIRGSLLAKKGLNDRVGGHPTNPVKGETASTQEQTAMATKELPFLPPINDKYNASLPSGGKTLTIHNNHSLADSIGLAPEVSGINYKKVGGVFGHFFADLSPGIRSLVLEKVNENKVLIQGAGYNNYYNRRQPSLIKADGSGTQHEGQVSHVIAAPGILSTHAEQGSHSNKVALNNNRRQKARRKGYRIQADYDTGTHNEREMWDHFQMQTQALEKLVVRMQRIRRLHVLRRAIRTVWKRNYACLCLQKLCRGWITRRIVEIYKFLVPIAVVRIQQAFRKYKSRNIINTWAWCVLRISRVVVRRLKQFVQACVMRWYRTHYRPAVRIQSMVRMHLQRARYFRMLGYLFHQHVVLLAVITIQRVARGRYVRKCIFAAMYEEEMIIRVDIPSATRIQRIWRGYLGRQLAIFQVKHSLLVCILCAIRFKYIYFLTLRLLIFVRFCRGTTALL
jgi:hypothetical protein